jgi:hypothetical protein
MHNKLLTTKVQLDDAAAMAAFLAAFPNSDVLGRYLAAEQGRLLLHHYNKKARLYYFVIRDAKTIKCFTVTDLTLDEAAEIADECEAITEWNYSSFQGAVERGLGITIERVH